MLKRLFVRPKSDDFPPGGESTKPATLIPDSDPSLILLLPAVAGVTTYDLRCFTEAHSAAAFIESSRPAAFYREGVIAFWALHAVPPAVTDAECAVLIRAAAGEELVHAYAFVDLHTALSYVRFRVDENGEPLRNFLVYWSAPVKIAANPSGEVRIEPSAPPRVRADASSATLVSIDEPRPPAEPEVSIEGADIPKAGPQPEAAQPPPDPVPDLLDAPVHRPEPVTASDELPREPVRELIPESRAASPTPPAETPKPRRRMSFRVRSKAVQLGIEGRTGRDIERELLAAFPRDRVPTYGTINRWLRDAGTGRAVDRRFEAMRKRVRDVLENRLDEIDELSLAEVAQVAALIERMRQKS